MKFLDFDLELKVRQRDQTDGQCVPRRCSSCYAFAHGGVMKVRKRGFFFIFFDAD